MLGLPENAKALLILDGCLAHDKEKLRVLGEHFIDYHFLLPHSSHITQPLDRGIFSYFKRVFKTTHNNDTQNKVGRRIMRGLNALSQVCTPGNIRSSYWRAGFELNYDDGKPSVTVNAETWLVQKNSPQTDVKEEFFINSAMKKRARTKTAFKGLTKKEKAENKKKKRKESEKEEEKTKETNEPVESEAT